MSEVSIEIGKFLALVVTLIGIFYGMSRSQRAGFEKHIDEKFKALGDELTRVEKNAATTAAEIARVERDLLELRAELPDRYVRREDYIRGQSLIESKLDALAVKLENLQLKEAKRGP